MLHRIFNIEFNFWICPLFWLQIGTFEKFLAQKRDGSEKKNGSEYLWEQKNQGTVAKKNGTGGDGSEV